MDPHSILGVDRNASEDDIRKAYRKKAMKNHPDKGGNPEEFKKIQNAYEKLTNPNQQEGPGPNDENLQEMFRNMFGGGVPQHQVNISIRDCFFGKMISLKTVEKTECKNCKCQICHGRGVINLGPMFQAPCPNCKGNKGSGCTSCGFQGFTTTEKSQTVEIPPRIAPGTRIRVNGNIMLIINVVADSDEPFTIEGNDLVFVQKITFKESIIGKKFKIPLLTGEIEYTSELIKINKKYIMRGMGLPPNGNLQIRFNIEYPENGLTAEQIDIISKHI
jgi:DnaJ family protein A protein 2